MRFPNAVARWFLAGLASLAACLAWVTRASAQDLDVYDAVIIGGGPSGYAAALSARREGAKRVLVVERRLGGGEGRIQTVLVERSTAAQYRRLGVGLDVFQPLKGMTIHREGKKDVTVSPHETLEEIAPAGPGAKTFGMFLKRAPVGFAEIDEAVAAPREVAAKTPGIDIVDGMEVTAARMDADGHYTFEAEERDEHGKPVPGSTKRQQFRGRYFYDGSGFRGVARLFGAQKVLQGPEYPMITAVFHDDDASHFGRAYFTKVEHGGATYRVLIGGGKPGETTLNIDRPSDVDASSPAEVEAFAKAVARKTGFFSEHSLTLIKRPSAYNAQRSNSDRLLVGPEGQERGMIGGDGANTGTPWTAMGYNLAVHTGVLFGEFYKRAEAARTPEEARDVRLWAHARLTGQIAMLHTLDRAMHVGTGAPQTQGKEGRVALLGDVRATVRETAKTAGAWVALGASRVAHAASKRTTPRATRSAPVRPAIARGL